MTRCFWVLTLQQNEQKVKTERSASWRQLRMALSYRVDL
jgi:hypothetical protein